MAGVVIVGYPFYLLYYLYFLYIFAVFDRLCNTVIQYNIGHNRPHVMKYWITPTFSDIDMFLLMCATCEDGKLYLGEFAGI